MSDSRLSDYLDHMQQAAVDARSFVEGLNKSAFLADKRTQQAVTMSLVIIGEAAAKVIENYADIVERHQEIPWRRIRGMRNQITHGYFAVDLDVVWETVQSALPELLERLPAVRGDADD